MKELLALACNEWVRILGRQSASYVLGTEYGVLYVHIKAG